MSVASSSQSPKQSIVVSVEQRESEDQYIYIYIYIINISILYKLLPSTFKLILISLQLQNVFYCNNKLLLRTLCTTTSNKFPTVEFAISHGPGCKCPRHSATCIIIRL